MLRGLTPLGVRLALAMILAVAALLFFTGLDWGLPSWWRHAIVFQDGADRDASVELLSRRERVEGWIAFNIRKRREEAAVRESGLLGGPGPVGEGELLRLPVWRSMCLSSAGFEENLALAAISGLDPARGKLDPGLFQYGGAFLYGAAAWLGGAGGLGLVRLVPDVRYYLGRPREMARVFRAARALCALFGVLAVLAAFQLARRLGGPASGLAAAALTALSPLLVAHAHLFRAHLFAVPWALWALERMARLQTSHRMRDATLAGLFAGLAAASAPYHVCLALPLLLAHVLAWRGGPDAPSASGGRGALRLGASVAAFAGVLIAVNPCLWASLGTLVVEWRDHGVDASGNPLFGRPSFEAFLRLILGGCPHALGPVGLVWALLGFASGAWRRQGWLLVASFLSYAALVGLRRGHTPEDLGYLRFGMILVPLSGAFVGLWIARRPHRVAIRLALVLGSLALFQLPLALNLAWNFHAAASRNATSLEAGRCLIRRAPAGAAVSFDAIPHPADTPLVDPRRYRIRFAPGALGELDAADFWVLSETCPAAWRSRVEESFEAVDRIRKPASPFPCLFPFRDPFAMANRDFTIYAKRGAARLKGSKESRRER